MYTIYKLIKSKPINININIDINMIVNLHF